MQQLLLKLKRTKTKKMAEGFRGIVQDIVDQYINSILFIDERAFPQDSESRNREKGVDPQKELNTSEVSRAFAKAHKICGFYAPRTTEDIEECKRLVINADIVVLDWDIKITPHFSRDEEGQDDETDDRGCYSKQLIQTIVDNASSDKLRVIFIYTGESDPESIVSQIQQSLGSCFQTNPDRLEVYSENVHVLVRLKPESRVKYSGKERFVIPYSSLPDRIIDTFSDYVQGLAPCFAMKSLTAIRNSAAKVLNIYNSDLDPEIVGHQMSLHNPNDAKAYLSNAIGSAFTELIMSNNEINTDLWAEEWIDSQFPSNTIDKQFQGGTLHISSSKLKAFFNTRLSAPSLKDRLNTSFNAKCNANEDKIKASLSSLFHHKIENIDISKYRFASLSLYKNILSLPSPAPTLTLGTIVARQNNGMLYLCIQQRCDTARVPITGMGFLFLPLYKEKQNKTFGAIALAPGENYYIKQSSTDAVIFDFEPQEDKKPVIAQKIGNKYLFTSKKETFEWKNELKDIIAQQIVSAFASHFARVGVDGAEWLRIEGKGQE